MLQKVVDLLDHAFHAATRILGEWPAGRVCFERVLAPMLCFKDVSIATPKPVLPGWVR